MGGKSKSKSSSATTQADNRIVAEGSTIATAGSNIVNAGADKIAELNSQLLGHLAETQAKFATETTASVGDLYARSGANVTQSLDSLLELTDKVTGQLIDRAAATGDGARALAQTAIAAYQPPDSKQGETLQRLGYAAAAVVAGVVLFSRK